MTDPPEVPRTYLGWSLVAAVLCFLPIGLVAAWFGLRVQSAVQAGDLPAAERASRWARRWLIVTVAVGVGIYVVIGATLLLLGATWPGG
jgi:sterol desaturase/sphingolipid hydroxylase (fatty acid hydroxylase superfamily)